MQDIFESKLNVQTKTSENKFANKSETKNDFKDALYLKQTNIIERKQ